MACSCCVLRVHWCGSRYRSSNLGGPLQRRVNAAHRPATPCEPLVTAGSARLRGAVGGGADRISRYHTAVQPLPRVSSALHIAVVDDEVDITLLLANYLKGHGFRVTQLHRGQALMELMPTDPPALVLLDLGLPGEDGFAIARQLREHWRCGLVIVTGRGDAVDKVVGLEVGADDYVTKPFDLRELLARIKAVLRRLAPAEPAPSGGATAGTAPRSKLCFAGWELDTGARRLTSPQGEDVALTSGEFDLLSTFAQHAGRVLSRDFLLEQTRGREAGPFDRTIDVQVGRLRKKLEADAEDPQIIKSVRGAGYIMVASVSPS
jgi:two-component system OmpR family response regulator